MKKAIFLLLAGIGDALLFVPTIVHFRKMHPDAHLTALVMYKNVKDILDKHPDLDEVIFFDFLKEGYIKSLFFVLQLRKNNYDLSMLAFPANRYQPNLISFLIGAKQRLGHLYEVNKLISLSFLHTDRIPLEYSWHQVNANLKFLEFLGADSHTFTRDLFFPITQNDSLAAKNFLKQHRVTAHDFVVGIHPGSSELGGMIHKRWPKERFAAVADMICKRMDVKILLFGGHNEDHIKQDISRMMTHPPILVDDLTLFQNAALIKRCDAFICNNTLLMHLASHFSVPTLVISGHINPYRTAPLYKKSTTLTPPRECQPYYVGRDLVCKYADTPQYCLNSITVQHVYDAFLSLIT